MVLDNLYRQWYEEFTTKITQFGFKQSPYDHCLFVMNFSDWFITLIIYVDDILTSGTDQVKIQALKQFLDNEFTIKDMRDANFFLRIDIQHTTEGILISQQKIILDILQNVAFVEVKATPTPLRVRCKMQKANGIPLTNHEQFRRVIERLLYLTITIPELSFVVQKLSQFMSSSTDKH